MLQGYLSRYDANDNELLEAASWIDWNAAEGAAGM